MLDEQGGIFALKRVRVGGEDPKAMQSFRNEIHLMESLRGNPCIVQLIDSEVLPTPPSPHHAPRASTFLLFLTC